MFEVQAACIKAPIHCWASNWSFPYLLVVTITQDFIVHFYEREAYRYVGYVAITNYPYNRLRVKSADIRRIPRAAYFNAASLMVNIFKCRT